MVDWLFYYKCKCIGICYEWRFDWNKDILFENINRLCIFVISLQVKTEQAMALLNSYRGRHRLKSSESWILWLILWHNQLPLVSMTSFPQRFCGNDSNKRFLASEEWLAPFLELNIPTDKQVYTFGREINYFVQNTNSNTNSSQCFSHCWGKVGGSAQLAPFNRELTQGPCAGWGPVQICFCFVFLTNLWIRHCYL